MNPSHFEFTAERLQEADDLCAKSAERFQDYVYEKTLFDQLAKDFLASLKMNYSGESDAGAETAARASGEWKMFRAEQMERLKEAGRREIQYENAKRRWETARSGLSLRKEQAKMGIS
jgi:hypothetical protein